MIRYIATVAIAGLLLAVALRSQNPASASLSIPDAGATLRTSPEVEAVTVPGGQDLTIRYRFAGSVSRARLTYRLGGENHTIEPVTDCQKSLDSTSGISDEGYVTVVKLTGFLPDGASDLRVLQENETGTQSIAVEFN